MPIAPTATHDTLLARDGARKGHGPLSVDPAVMSAASTPKS
jgi:hypothetical protein